MFIIRVSLASPLRRQWNALTNLCTTAALIGLYLSSCSAFVITRPPVLQQRNCNQWNRLVSNDLRSILCANSRFPKSVDASSPLSATITTAMEDKASSIKISKPRELSNLAILNETTGHGQYLHNGGAEEEAVPTNLRSAFQRFFFGRNVGPLATTLTIMFVIGTRICLHLKADSNCSVSVIDGRDICAGVVAILFWWFQEYIMHDKLLHSPFNWMGKSIHQLHHERPYFHISIDPPELLLGWLGSVFLFLRAIMPLPLALSALIGYSIAGMIYEWTHYIVHTKVKPRFHMFKRMRDNHIRHHIVDDSNWYAFSVPVMDDLFGTNPTVEEVRKRKKEERF